MKERPPSSVYEVPLYTLSEAAQIVDAGAPTVHRWARGYTYRTPGGIKVEAEPLITTTGVGRRPVVPFVGLAETYVLNAFRRAGVPMQRIRPALARLADELGIAAALASERLKTDGTEILYEYGEEDPSSGVSDLVVVRNGHRVFTEVVLSRIRAGEDYQAVARDFNLPWLDVKQLTALAA